MEPEIQAQLPKTEDEIRQDYQIKQKEDLANY